METTHYEDLASINKNKRYIGEIENTIQTDVSKRHTIDVSLHNNLGKMLQWKNQEWQNINFETSSNYAKKIKAETLEIIKMYEIELIRRMKTGIEEITELEDKLQQEDSIKTHPAILVIMTIHRKDEALSMLKEKNEKPLEIYNNLKSYCQSLKEKINEPQPEAVL